MAVVTTCKKQGVIGDLRYQIWYVTVADNDTEIVINTGQGRVLYHEISPPAVAAKYVTTATVSGGVITYTFTDHDASGYFYVLVLTDF